MRGSLSTKIWQSIQKTENRREILGNATLVHADVSDEKGHHSSYYDQLELLCPIANIRLYANLTCVSLLCETGQAIHFQAFESGELSERMLLAVNFIFPDTLN